jgi:hypothetical protein
VGVGSAPSTQRRERRSQGAGADSMTELAKETVAGQGGPDPSMPTARRGIAYKAASHKQQRFGNRDERINAELRYACWRAINKNVAYGVERGSAEDDAQHLESNIRDLVGRLKRQTSHAKRVRRHDSPSCDGPVHNGFSCQRRPSSMSPPALAVRPPHCLKKRVLRRQRIDRGSIGPSSVRLAARWVQTHRRRSPSQCLKGPVSRGPRGGAHRRGIGWPRACFAACLPARDTPGIQC